MNTKRLDNYTRVVMLDMVSKALHARYSHQRELARGGDASFDTAQGVAVAAQALADSLLETREERIAFLQACGCAFVSGYSDKAA